MRRRIGPAVTHGTNCRVSRLSADARSSRSGRGGTKRELVAPYLVVVWLLVPGCTAIGNFGSFKFGSDAGSKPATDAGDHTPDSGQSDAGGPLCGSDTERACQDGRDNDCDGLTDCDDPDCSNSLKCCRPTEIPEVSCSGGVDNDCDGKVDCDDTDCSAAKACCSGNAAEVGATACSDGVDNDCDGLTDCQESACAAQSTCCQATAENDHRSCSDGVDNDCDGKLDCADSDCAVISDCCTKTEPIETSCGDAIDNDCDGKVDCRDSDCAALPACTLCSPSSDKETNCSDKKDNDCDKDPDCYDSDCANDAACCVKTGTEADSKSCVDTRDNDCDGLVDCADPDCASQLDCCVSSDNESSEIACSDGKDNDCNSMVDCADPHCANTVACCVSSGDEVGTDACSDGMDNDCDGAKDCNDSGCLGMNNCCVNSGLESDHPNDGVDNDCNGLIDIPVVSNAKPANGVPASGAEVAITYVPSIVADASLECSTRPIARLNNPSYGPCTVTGSTVAPFTSTQSSDAGNDGVWVTTLRWAFKNGAHSDEYSFKYYVHHTLHGIGHCSSPITDSSWFDLARTRLVNVNSKLFHPDLKTDTFLTNPFVHVTYEPPLSATGRFLLDGKKQVVEMWSLRKRFVLDSANKMLLIVRNYVSQRGVSVHPPDCAAARFHYHSGTTQRAYDCDAVALNRNGAGVCMLAAGATPVFSHSFNDKAANMLGWPATNEFMWRQLVDALGTHSLTTTPALGSIHAYMYEENVSYRNFSPKCTQKPCPNGAAIFLPDRAFFP
jgi:hypothetical protein